MNIRAYLPILLMSFCLGFTQVASAFVLNQQSSCNMQDMLESMDNQEQEMMQMHHNMNAMQDLMDCCELEMSACCGDSCKCASSAISFVFLLDQANQATQPIHQYAISFIASFVSPPDLALPKRPPIALIS